MLLHPTDHAGYRRPIKHHSRLLAPILSDAAPLSFFRIGNFDELHISPMAKCAKGFRDDLHDIIEAVNNFDPALNIRLDEDFPRGPAGAMMRYDH
jgi:hypothetical protein